MTDRRDDHGEHLHDRDPDPAEEREAFETADAAAGSAKPLRDRRDRRRVHRPFFFSRSEELSRATLKLRERQQNIDLKRLLAFFAIGAVGVQLLFADFAFGYYVWRTLDSGLVVAPEVLIAWLSATVVEVIGIVLIIARNLFPAPKTREVKPPGPKR